MALLTLLLTVTTTTGADMSSLQRSTYGLSSRSCHCRWSIHHTTGTALLLQELHDGLDRPTRQLELDGGLADLLEQQAVELLAQLREEHRRPGRRAKLDPLVDRDDTTGD